MNCFDVQTRMMGLSDSRRSFKIGLTIQTQLLAPDIQTDGRTLHDGEDRAMQIVAQVKTFITRSIKMYPDAVQVNFKLFTMTSQFLRHKHMINRCLINDYCKHPG